MVKFLRFFKLNYDPNIFVSTFYDIFFHVQKAHLIESTVEVDSRQSRHPNLIELLASLQLSLRLWFNSQKNAASHLNDGLRMRPEKLGVLGPTDESDRSTVKKLIWRNGIQDNRRMQLFFYIFYQIITERIFSPGQQAAWDEY